MSGSVYKRQAKKNFFIPTFPTLKFNSTFCIIEQGFPSNYHNTFEKAERIILKGNVSFRYISWKKQSFFLLRCVGAFYLNV